MNSIPELLAHLMKISKKWLYKTKTFIGNRSYFEFNHMQMVYYFIFTQYTFWSNLTTAHNDTTSSSSVIFCWLLMKQTQLIFKFDSINALNCVLLPSSSLSFTSVQNIIVLMVINGIFDLLMYV